MAKIDRALCSDPLLQSRVFARIHRGSDCWLWTSSRTVAGYGVYEYRGRRYRAHRLVWQIVHPERDLAPGEQVLHHCDNPICCNPDHLFAGSIADNVADMMAKGRHSKKSRTHCPAGHEFSTQNTRLDKAGARRCRACERIRSQLRRERQQ